MTAPQLTGYVDLASLENAVNSSPALLGPAVVLDDSGATCDGGTLSVTGALAEDRVGIASVGDVMRAGDVISYQGTSIATVGAAAGETGIGEALLVTFNASATADSVQAVTRALTYQDVSDTPTAQRRLTVILTDGVGMQTVPEQGDTGFTQYVGDANPFNSIQVGTHADPSFGNLDGDGDLDMVTGDDSGALRYFRNDGTAESSDFVELTGDENPFNGLSVAPSTAPELVDLNGDGLLDLVTGGTNADPQLRYFQNTGTASAPVFS